MHKFNLELLFSLLLLMLVGCKEAKKDQVGKETDKEEVPNFLVIIADDAGWNDFSYHGSKILTPIIDSLAGTGVELDRFYVAPTCSPSRASLFTGKPASRMGIVAPISGRSDLTLPDSVTTLPQALKQQGYKTALFGKWHLGLKPETGPQAYGFDYSYGFLHGQIDQYTHRYKNGDKSWHRNGEMIEEEGHTTDLITEEAIKWIEEKDSSPFYLQVAYSAPHFPLQEEEKCQEPYKDVFEEKSRVKFAAAMAHMDYSIGLLLKHLKEKGFAENTVIFFMSDNGAMEDWYPKEQYNGKFEPNPVLGNNKPLRDWKTSNYEGAIRVPAIVNWNGKLTKKKNSNYISIGDLMPTILFLVGAEVPPSVEGKNAWVAISEQEADWKNSIYIRGHLQESLIQKPWKLIRTRYLEGLAEFELYNIEEDPEEIENLIEEHSDIAEQMKKNLEEELTKDAPEVNL